MTMTSRDFLERVAILSALMTVISLLEIARPLHVPGHAGRGRARANLGLTILVFTLNWVLITATSVIALALSFAEVGLVTLTGLPVLVQITLGVLMLDFFTYAAHLSMHKLPLLWRFHRVHHSDPFVDVTTTYRFHPLEGFWRFLWTLIPAVVFGLPAQAIVVYRLVSAINGLLEHANVAVPSRLDSVLSWVWVTPNMHKVHHSSERDQTDSNYGNIVSIYDRVFGTFTPTDRASSVSYGLGDSDLERVKLLRPLLGMPFERNSS